MSKAPRPVSAIVPAVLLAGLALGGCATTPDKPAVAAAQSASPAADDPYPSSNYGLFAAGEAALRSGRPEEAARYFARASQGAGDQSPADQALIRQKAFEAAVMAGDIDKAAALAPPIQEAPPPSGGASKAVRSTLTGQAAAPSSASQMLARLVRAVDALAEGRAKEADADLTAPNPGPAFGAGVLLLRPWAAAAAGDAKRSVESLDGPAPRLTQLALLEGQAMLLERAKRYDEAETDYKSLVSNAQLGPLYVGSYGAFLERRGRAKDAAALYADTLKHTPNDRDLKAALARAEASGVAPAALNLKQGAAKAMTAAAEQALIDKRGTEAEIYLRLALRLDPSRNDAWVLLGDLRARAGQPLVARAAYMRVPTTSAEWPEARQRIISSYQAEGDNETALKLTRDALKQQPEDRELLITEADLLRAMDRFEEAVTVLNKVIDSGNSSGDWVLYFERGTALDRAGHWAEAEKDLLKALSLQPDEPDVLNYLGYSWVIHGEKLQQAMGMLQKAFLAQPDSGEIADSLGWAYYNLGDFKQAVQRLERAVALSPVSPEITDHLGDAYWRAGRHTEAQYQWSRVLTLQPSDELKTAAQKKLTSGLTPVIAPGGTRS
jgi:Flp pilus assembly protein TadD